MTEVAIRQPTNPVELAKLMANSTLLPRAYQQQPANLLFAFEYADALGIPRVNALTSIHVIDGKPTASADLIAALVRRAGHRLRVEGDDTYAEAVIIRADDPDYQPQPIRWDEAKARRAGKWGNKGPWTNYPAAMLRSRAITEAARMWASDALYGVIYTPEELGAPVDERGAPIRVEATVGPPPPRQTRAPEPAQRPASIDDPDAAVAKITTAIITAATIDDLTGAMGLAKGVQLNDATKADLRREYDAAMQRLTAPAEPTHTEAVDAVQQTLDAEVVDDPAA